MPRVRGGNTLAGRELALTLGVSNPRTDMTSRSSERSGTEILFRNPAFAVHPRLLPDPRFPPRLRAVFAAVVGPMTVKLCREKPYQLLQGSFRGVNCGA